MAGSLRYSDTASSGIVISWSVLNGDRREADGSFTVVKDFCLEQEEKMNSKPKNVIANNLFIFMHDCFERCKDNKKA